MKLPASHKIRKIFTYIRLGLIDVIIGETRIVHLEESQYQFFRYTIDEGTATAGNYLLRIETVAVTGDVIVSPILIHNL